MTNVVNLHGPDDDAPRLHDVPALLRKLADDLERGEPANAQNAIVVLEREGQAFTVYGFGPDGGDGARAVGLLEWGKHWLMTRALDIADAT